MRPDGMIRLGLTADPISIRGALAGLMAHPALRGLDPDSRAIAELVLAEVLNNIAEHAYGGRGGPVSLALRSRAGELVCRIADKGRAMPGNRLPDRTAPLLADPSALPQGGFGWLLIRDLTSRLRYRRGAVCNILLLSIPVNS